ncbi:hypothetical protein Ocin01_03375 [Orchesella cincta]|uniref:histone acetyltransferase n=1 Tax=Orchesella cincta TaxID=48709 RepID=A0A1D2NDH3_ORCCI|nr:hypothetical protein Ocin01_03375 [Orchesella cincta]
MEMYVACQACFNNRSKKGPLTFNTGSSSKDIPRGRFEIRNNFITISEPVVECTLCERKFHRVCVNYPEPTTSSTYLKSEFVCKSCEEKYHILPICISLPVSLSAQSISHTTLSKYMEQRIQAIFPMTPEILIRVASNVPKKYTVEGSLGKYFDKRQPDFPYMAKTISCFQLNERKKYHLIFVLYVQEYDQDCPEPNRNTIYISVLDSVRLFKPAESRTQMFHLVLLTYFDYMRKCGFKQIFLWSCPPGGSGMDYVFYRKPRCQPIITADLLNNWYRRLFAVGLDMNILAKFSTLNDWAAQEIRSMEDFKEKFPFFEGDHWPDEVAKLIDRINKTETPEDWIFKNLQSKLARNKNSFYVLTLNPTTGKNYYRNDVIILSALADNRDRLVKFFRSNYLEFEDIRKATYATQALVLQIALEQLGSTLESMGFNCNQCNKGIRNGHACMECEYRVCNECWSSNEHQHNRLKEIVLPIRIPNLFTEEYKWNSFKDTILGSSIQNVNSGVGRLAAATKDTTMRIRHCSECTWDLCGKCVELRREMWDLLQLANVKFPNDLTKNTVTTIRAVYQR